MISEYEVCVVIHAEAWLTIEAESEDAAKRHARDLWSYSDLQNGEVAEVLTPDAQGVYRA